MDPRSQLAETIGSLALALHRDDKALSTDPAATDLARRARQQASRTLTPAQAHQMLNNARAVADPAFKKALFVTLSPDLDL